MTDLDLETPYGRYDEKIVFSIQLELARIYWLKKLGEDSIIGIIF